MLNRIRVSDLHRLFGLRTSLLRLPDGNRLVYDSGTRNRKVPDRCFTGPRHSHFFAVQEQFNVAYAPVAQQKTLLRAPDKAFPFFEHGLFLRTGIGPDQKPGVIHGNDFKIELIACRRLLLHHTRRRY